MAITSWQMQPSFWTELSGSLSESMKYFRAFELAAAKQNENVSETSPDLTEAIRFGQQTLMTKTSSNQPLSSSNAAW